MVPVQAPTLPVLHCTHEPARGPASSQTGAAALHSASAAHARHVWETGLQTGVAPEQSALTLHAAQVSVARLHTGAGAMQAVDCAAVHCSQRPAFAPAISHAGVAPVQSVALAGLHARHVNSTVSHTGVPPAQSALVTHARHTFAVRSHTFVGAIHAAGRVAVHWTQCPEFGPAVAQAGVAPVQSVGCAASQARQVRVPASQIGVAPLQFALVRHAQVCVVVWQAGVSPPHAVMFVAEHCAHEPAAEPAERHAGVAAEHSVSFAHARHRRVPVSHTGRLPPHWASVRHCEVRLQRRTLNTHNPGCAGIVLLVVSRFNTAAVRDPGSAW